MKTTVERESPTRLRLAVEVETEEVSDLYRETLGRLAREVRIPGFRKGKVPRPVLESRIGKDAIREELVRDALPGLLSRAIAGERLRPVATSGVEVLSFEEGGSLTFAATVEVVPEIRLPDYRGVEVEVEPSAATDEEVGEQVERLRDRFSTLEPVPRPATGGDHVLLNIDCYRHAEQIEAASAKDLLYEVGSKGLVPELDAELEGKRAGDIFKFNAVLPERFGEPHGGQEVSFQVLVKEVNAKRPPELDDEFARTASEFDTLGELRAELARRIEAFKGLQQESQVRNQIVEDLLDRTDIAVPEALLDREMRARLGALLSDLQRHGVTLEQYLEQAGISEDELVEAHRRGAERAIAAELLLEAVAQAEGMEVAPDELREEIGRIAGSLKRPEGDVARDLAESGRVERLAGDILRRKALDYLVQNARVATRGS